MEDPFGASMFGRRGGAMIPSSLRTLSGMISGMHGRLRQLLEQIQQKDDPSVQLIALQELSEILLVSTEDNLAGHFSPDQYVKELIAVMQPNEFGEENPEIMLVACRCLANMMEALPASTGSLVYNGAVPVLVSKLLEISFMDLAEQALLTLEKISAEFPSSIVREGGLAACLQFLDFFHTSTQRTAVTTAANCCRNIPDESFASVKDVMPVLLNVLNNSDQKVVEQGCLCVSRIVESFKYQNAKLEQLMSAELLRTMLRLLLPGSTNIIGAHIHTQFLRVISISAKASPALSIELLRMDVVETLYQILTGVSPPSETEDAASNIDSVVVMQALIHRPRDQVFETLNVICELLPSLDAEAMAFFHELIDNAGLTGERMTSVPERASVQKRVELLAECAPELRRFATILFPTLTDAYSSTVNHSVRQKVLMAQLKMLTYLDVDILTTALRPVPYASFLASILSQQDHPFLVTAALQATEMLLKRMESVYRYQFYREGVITEIRKLAERALEEPEPKPSKDAGQGSGSTTGQRELSLPLHNTRPHEEGHGEDSDMEDEDEPEEHHIDDDDASMSSDSSVSPNPAFQARHIASARDIVTKCARQFIEKHEKDIGHELREKAARNLTALQDLVAEIADCYETTRFDEGAQLFARLATYFEGDALESITSHELLTARVVDTLLDIFQDTNAPAGIAARSAFVEVFLSSSGKQRMRTVSASSPATPFSVLVAKLHDLLSRAEHFEVITVHHNAVDSHRSSAASLLAKQIRIKLQAEDESGIPKPYRNIMVSIHAIATFKALDDYLRPRIQASDRPPRNPRMRDAPGSALNAYAAAIAEAAKAGVLPPMDHGASSSQESALPPWLNRPYTSRGHGKKSGSSKTAGKVTSQSRPTPSQDSPDRRRSRRRSGIPSAQEDEAQPAIECADEAQLSDEDQMDEQEDTEEVIGEFDEEVDDGASEPSAVTMEVGSTGKVMARQEDGTRVATPPQAVNPHLRPSGRAYTAEMARSLLHNMSGRSMSYASAVQALPTDWHLEFSVNGQPLSNETTIYRAVHFNQGPQEDVSVRNIWSSVHTINFKKVNGPPAAEPSRLTPSPDSSGLFAHGMPSSLEKNPTAAAILRLLRILHEVNAHLDDVLADKSASTNIKPEPLSQFVSTKLTAKLNRQLEEPLIVASNCLPSWSEDLARLYPFLFPFETRHLFLQSTSFGYSRSMTRWQSAQQNNDNRRDRHRDERPFLGRLQRQKVRISRHKILESAVKVMDLYGSSPSVLEVEYFDEVGTGLGPTLEFYSSVSKEFSKRKLKLWRESDSNKNEYVFGKNGLFPAPMSEEQIQSENGQKVVSMFHTLGIFVARSMLDSRIIDISFNSTFFRVGSDENSIAPSIGAVRLVDEELANSLQTLKQFSAAKKRIETQARLTPAQKAQKIARIQVAGATVDDLALDFTLPGYPIIELVPNGSNMAVTIDNVGLYVDKVVEFTLSTGVQKQIEAFRAGFSEVFPYSALGAFTPDELVMLFGRVDEDWSIESE